MWVLTGLLVEMGSSWGHKNNTSRVTRGRPRDGGGAAPPRSAAVPHLSVYPSVGWGSQGPGLLYHWFSPLKALSRPASAPAAGTVSVLSCAPAVPRLRLGAWAGSPRGCYRERTRKHTREHTRVGERARTCLCWLGLRHLRLGEDQKRFRTNQPIPGSFPALLGPLPVTSPRPRSWGSGPCPSSNAILPQARQTSLHRRPLGSRRPMHSRQLPLVPLLGDPGGWLVMVPSCPSGTRSPGQRTPHPPPPSV